MKKIFIILLVLITTASNTFALNLFDEEQDDLFMVDVPDDTKEDGTIPYIVKKEPVIKEPVKTEPAKSETISSDSADKKEAASDKVSQINSIKNDEQKIIEWEKFNSTGNYVIINKKNCSATVYDKNGRKIKSFEIGVGREIGDDFNDTSGLLGKAKNTTPAGEFTLIPNVFNKSAYGDLTLSLGAKANKANSTKKVVALHKVPKFRENDRLKKFYDGDLANNRMSHGCINFLEDDFKELTKYIRGGLKTYILPEESDNHLVLNKNSKGKFEFTQTKY